MVLEFNRIDIDTIGRTNLYAEYTITDSSGVNLLCHVRSFHPDVVNILWF